MEVAQQPGAHLRIVARQRLALGRQVLVDALVVGRGRLGDELARQRRFQDAAHREDLARLFGAGLGHEGALVRHDLDDLVLGQHQQRRAHLGAADAVDTGQGLLAQLGAGRQAVRNDSRDYVFGDRLGGHVRIDMLGHGSALAQRLRGWGDA
ncbi:hypothetical protein D9M72_570160 [compost metagenome]